MGFFRDPAREKDRQNSKKAHAPEQHDRSAFGNAEKPVQHDKTRRPESDKKLTAVSVV